MAQIGVRFETAVGSEMALGLSLSFRGLESAGLTQLVPTVSGLEVHRCLWATHQGSGEMDGAIVRDRR